jgi:hypothetical protein
MSTWNTAPGRPVATHRAFNAWHVALLTYLLGLAVVLSLGLVLGTVGYLLISDPGLSGDPEGLLREDLMGKAVTAAVAITMVGVALQAWFIHRRGGARPVLAPVTALAASGLLTFVLTPVMPDIASLSLQAVVEVTVLALLIRPRPS